MCVDDFSRYTWMKFIYDKFETFKVCQTLFLQIQREKNIDICRIRSDHGREFENKYLLSFMRMKEFSMSSQPR